METMFNVVTRRSAILGSLAAIPAFNLAMGMLGIDPIRQSFTVRFDNHPHEFRIVKRESGNVSAYFCGKWFQIWRVSDGWSMISGDVGGVRGAIKFKLVGEKRLDIDWFKIAVPIGNA